MLSHLLFPQSVFTVLLGPFTFFNAQKTKYLQILTSLMRWIGKKTFLQYSLVTCCFSFHYFLPSLSVTSPFLQPLFPHTHISILSASPSVSFIPPSCLHLPVWLLRLRSVHHGLVLLCVFDSHLLSFLSLTGLTARPKLDWTVTHMATDENKPPVLGPLLKSQHH